MFDTLRMFFSWLANDLDLVIEQFALGLGRDSRHAYQRCSLPYAGGDTPEALSIHGDARL